MRCFGSRWVRAVHSGASGEAVKNNANAAVAAGELSPGSFFEFLRRQQQQGYGGSESSEGKSGNQAVGNDESASQGTLAQKPLNICPGNLRLLKPLRSPDWKPYKSPDTIAQFFSKMDAAIKVGSILREMGWNTVSRSKIEELNIPWAPLVVIQVLRQPLEKQAAWGFFQWLKGVDDYRHTEHTYNSMIEVYGRAGDVAGMQQVLDDMAAYGCGMNVVIFTTVIYWYNRAGSLDRALEMWNQMTKVGCRPNVVTYTMLMSMLTKIKRFDKVGEVFKDMVSAGCRPNVRTYTVLIQCLALSGHMDAALLVFRKLDSVRASPTAATFRVLMAYAGSLGNVELVKELLEGMKQVNQKPNSKMYFSVMDSLKKAGKLEEAGDVLSEMEAMMDDKGEGIPCLSSEQQEQRERREQGEEGEQIQQQGEPPLQDVEVMEEYDRPLVDMKAFSKVLEKWGPDTPSALQAANFRWDPWKVLRVLMGISDPATAYKFFTWVEKQPGYKHDSFVYSKMISTLCRHQHFSYIELLLRQNSPDIQIIVITLNSVMFTLAVAKQPQMVLKVYYWMKDHLKLKPNTRTYTILIDLLVKEQDYSRAKAMYEEMVESGCQPDSHAYTVLLQCLGRAGRVGEAEDIFNKIDRPNVVNYTSLINTYIKCGRVRDALVLFRRMMEQGVKPNAVTYTVLSHGLRRANMLQELAEVEKKLAKVDFYHTLRVSSADELLVRDTILNCLLKQQQQQQQKQEEQEVLDSNHQR